MPLTFRNNRDGMYFVFTFSGKITDAELFDAYQDFYTGEKWAPGTNELNDLSNADLTLVTEQGLRRVAAFSTEIFKEHKIKTMKTAMFATKDFNFGLARMYEIYIDESPERIMVFRKLDDAKKWLSTEYA